MDLRTTYLGMELKNPLVTAASPLARDLDGIRRLEDAGASAVTLFSLFEEQIEQETERMAHYLDLTSDKFAAASSYFPQPEAYHKGPVEYLSLVSKAHASLDIPVIASLNGISIGGWVEYSRLIQDAGASALELNIYWVETNPCVNGQMVEKRHLEIIEAVAQDLSIPVTVKVGPYFSPMASFAHDVSLSGAKGMVLFNRFYQPDFDIDRREVRPQLAYSTRAEMRLPLHWIAILSDQIKLDFALSTGVHTGRDALKAMMAGAKVATCASALLTEGPEYLKTMLRDIEVWMEENSFQSIGQMQGSMSYAKVANRSAFERANYMKELQSYRPDPSMLR